MEGRYTTASAEQTEQLAARFGAALSGDETVAMFGGMGMGKTAFARGLAKGLEIPPEEISSPTFAIVHEHRGRVKLCHYDMYRVESWEDLDSTGFFESVGRCVNLVEWSENIENALPAPRWQITISKPEASADDDARVIDIQYIDE